MPPVAAEGAAAATLLVWYKANEHVFPPAAVLAGLLVTASASPAASVAVPWLAGHAVLYASAHARYKRIPD